MKNLYIEKRQSVDRGRKYMSCLQVPSKKQTERVKKRERGKEGEGEELETSGREI